MDDRREPDGATLALLSLAASFATGDEEVIAREVLRAVAAGVPAGWADELVLQSVLVVGWPRALTAAALWRSGAGHPAPEDDADAHHANLTEWLERGEVTCRVVYGRNYERLRANVRALHPALDAWMVLEGYGRTLSRPGLDLGRRELCTVAQCLVLGAWRQLHSHLRGARHAGAGEGAVTAALEVARPHVTTTMMQRAEALWREVGQ